MTYAKCTPSGLEPRVAENGLPKFDICMIPEKGNEKGKEKVPHQVANSLPGPIAASANHRVPDPNISPSENLTENMSSSAGGPVSGENVPRVQPKPQAKSRKGKGKQAGATTGVGSAPPGPSASALAGIPLSDFIHFSPNDPIQPFSRETPSISSGNPTETPRPLADFNIDPALLAEDSQTIHPPSSVLNGPQPPFLPPPLNGIIPGPPIMADMATLGSTTNTTDLVSGAASGSPSPATASQQVVSPEPLTAATTPSAGCTNAADAASSSSGGATMTVTPEDVPKADDAPKLIQDQLKLLCQTLVPNSVVGRWTELLQGWIKLERALEFESKVCTWCMYATIILISWSAVRVERGTPPSGRIMVDQECTQRSNRRQDLTSGLRL